MPSLWSFAGGGLSNYLLVSCNATTTKMKPLTISLRENSPSSFRKLAINTRSELRFPAAASAVACLAIKREVASSYGILPYTIDNTLDDAFGQRIVSTIYTTLQQYHVILEVDPKFQSTRLAKGIQMKSFLAAAVLLAITALGVGQSAAQTGASSPGSIGALEAY